MHKSGYLLSALSVYEEFLAPKDDGKESKLEREIEVRFKIAARVFYVSSYDRF